MIDTSLVDNALKAGHDVDIEIMEENKKPDYMIIGNRASTLRPVDIDRIRDISGGKMTPSLARVLRREFGVSVYSVPDHKCLSKFRWEFWK